MSIQAMKQALEELEWSHPTSIRLVSSHQDAITALRAAIIEAEKCEPVAWLNKKIPYMSVLTKPDDGGGWFPVFTTPQPAIPDGWQLVPVEPTQEMVEVWKSWGGSEERDYVVVKRRELYKAMLATAPNPTEGIEMNEIIHGAMCVIEGRCLSGEQHSTITDLKQQSDEHKADAEIAIALCQKAEAELIALRAAIAEAERHEPFGYWSRVVWGHHDNWSFMKQSPEAFNSRTGVIGSKVVESISLYTTPQPAIPDGWQPIETAPRDGTDVLIYTMAGSMYVAAYDDAFSNVWRIRNDEGVNSRVVTHWMPLPAAPKPENSHDRR